MHRKRRRLAVVGLLALAVMVLAWLGVRWFSLSALEEPGRAETWLAWRAKRWLVGRSAGEIAAGPPASEQQAAMGLMQFRARCAACHGADGRQPTEIGRAMYPRATDLGATEAQAYSDAELFWIVRHGIRFTGMPGFGRELADEEIWPLVHYIRSLGAASAAEGAAPPES